MKPLFFILAAEGATDRMLLPVIRWTLREYLGNSVPINDQFATRSGNLYQKIDSAMFESGHCDLLLIHRDADSTTVAERVAEIDATIGELAKDGVKLPTHLHVVPVRMSEAWLLFDEAAIRKAAGHERGKAKLILPIRNQHEVADPKRVLRVALDTASELTGRKLDKFRGISRPWNVADKIEDFSPLRKLAAFREFEAKIGAFVRQWIQSQSTKV